MSAETGESGENGANGASDANDVNAETRGTCHCQQKTTGPVFDDGDGGVVGDCDFVLDVC